ncbi:MAG: lysophospholipid acyltransferase family protein [Saprospiraceae bacterium]
MLKKVFKEVSTRVIYWLFRLGIGIGGLIPFSLLHYFSNVLAFILQRVIRYRKKVIYQNIQNSFPQKSEAERQEIINKFYLNLSDTILEGLKGYSYPPEKLMERFRLKPTPKLNEYYEKGQSIVLVGAHFANWEWGMMCGGLHSKLPVMCYYQPIRNTLIDNFYRKKFSTGRNLTTVSSKNAVRNFVKYRKEAVGHLMISDQSPKSKNSFWLNFLNQDTICINGPEKLARKFNFPVFYMHINRIKRGYYEMEITEFEPSPKNTPEGEITTKFMKTLEQKIHETPENWLWSHKRWKKKRLN